MKHQQPSYIMAIDQYGNHYDDLGAHPRTELAKRLGYSAKSARKMYRDKIDGTSKCVGYVMGAYWCTLYIVKHWER